MMEVDVPDKRRPEQTKLTVRFSPTVAGAVVDAIVDGDLEIRWYRRRG